MFKTIRKISKQTENYMHSWKINLYSKIYLSLTENPWPKVKPDPPNTEGQLHNVLLKAFFEDKRKFSGNHRPHASTKPEFDNVKDMENLTLNQDVNQSETIKNLDKDSVSAESQNAQSSKMDKSENSEEVVDAVLLDNKIDRERTNTENKCWKKLFFFSNFFVYCKFGPLSDSLNTMFEPYSLSEKRQIYTLHKVRHINLNFLLLTIINIAFY